MEFCKLGTAMATWFNLPTFHAAYIAGYRIKQENVKDFIMREQLNTHRWRKFRKSGIKENVLDVLYRMNDYGIQIHILIISNDLCYYTFKFINHYSLANVCR